MIWRAVEPMTEGKKKTNLNLRQFIIELQIKELQSSPKESVHNDFIKCDTQE